jgi:hypothetical protein
LLNCASAEGAIRGSECIGGDIPTIIGNFGGDFAAVRPRYRVRRSAIRCRSDEFGCIRESARLCVCVADRAALWQRDLADAPGSIVRNTKRRAVWVSNTREERVSILRFFPDV